MTSELTYIYERLSNQARFIKYFIEGKIKISGREHADIVHDLRKLQFRPFPKKAKAVVAADPDASIIDPADLEETDDQSAAGSLSDYDYLLEMSISSLTAAKAKKLLAQRDEREKELHVLLELTPKQMWLTDLDAFDAAWEEVLERDEATYANSTAAVAKKGKGKVGGMKGNTLESAFAKAAALKAQQITDINSPPAKKAAVAKKATAPKAEAKPKVTLAKTKAEPAAKAGPSKAAPAKKKIVYDEDMSSSEADITIHDDDSLEQSAVSDNAPKMDEDEDEDDFVIRPPAKRKAAPLAQEEDEEDEEPVLKKAPAPVRAKKATSSKVIELSSDVDNGSESEAEMDEDEDEESFIVPAKKSRK
jgi:DNA topoisomerase-2